MATKGMVKIVSYQIKSCRNFACSPLEKNLDDKMFSQPFSTYYLPIPRHILHKPLIPSWEFGQLFRVGRAKLLGRWRRTIFGIFILFHLNLFFNLFQHRAEHDGNWGRGITRSTNFFGNIDSVCQKPKFFQCCFCRRLH